MEIVGPNSNILCQINTVFTGCLRTENSAKELVSLLTSLQKNYREPYPWSKNEAETKTYSANKSSKEIYDQLTKDFIAFEIISKDVCYNANMAYTTDVGITFSYPNIIVTYTDKWKQGVVYSVVKPGKYTVKFPIDNCDFKTTKTIAGSKSSLIFTSSKGIEISFNGKVNIEPQFELKISGLGAERICNELKQFKNAIISESYKGSYGITDKTVKRTNSHLQPKPKNILNKYEE